MKRQQKPCFVRTIAALLSLGLLLIPLSAAAHTRTTAWGPPSPPATYYGPVQANSCFVPAAQVTVTAWIDGYPCGLSETQQVGEQVVYAISVLPDGPGGTPGCGAPGRVVTFYVGTQRMTPTAVWDNSQSWELPLNPTCLFGDLDHDCDVDVADIMLVASRWNTLVGGPAYDPAYDLDHDGDIDVADIMLVAAAWGDTCGG
ncbi:MAG: hypothetical protein KKA73_22650 [Chloroflexi bacterium]|nr:hypothetical protein [Chloroflexota bacterium]MBU1750492.1 hypothetical protein [Chloroflexota bacterium]